MSTSLKDLAYTYIRGRLIDGHISPGARLSSRALAREIGVSFIPVREAITQLSAEGLVDHEPGVGTFAARVTQTDLRELYELREALEVHAIGLAAGKVTADELAMITAWNEKLRAIVERRRRGEDSSEPGAAFGGTGSESPSKSGARTSSELASSAARPAPSDSAGANTELRAWNDADLEFHSAILRSGGNGRLVRAVKDLRILTQVFRSQRVLRPAQDLMRAVEHHEALIESLARRDPVGARARMTDHIRFGCANALDAHVDPPPAS